LQAENNVQLRFNNQPSYGKKECNRETSKLEAFADDNTVIGRLTANGITAIKTILLNFGNISGLKCNVDKSAIMILGSEIAIPEFVTDSGFEVVNSVKILGISITKNFADLPQNFLKTEEKISNIKRFWQRFNLSIIGRLNIAKTLMLSQIGYFGSIIMPDPEQVKRLSQSINNFVKGNLNLCKDDICLAVDRGGIGMIDVEEFLCGLQCSWIKKCLNNCTIDN
jgi:hypothetical protein